MAEGLLGIVLHAHLPFVKNIREPNSLEERWLFEALAESYIPILNGLFDLCSQEIPFGIGVSLSPTLLEMMADPLLKARFKKYLVSMVEVAEKEVERRQGRMKDLAKMYVRFYQDTYNAFVEKYKEDMIAAWKGLEDTGRVELLTSSATHCYLPLILHKEALAVQVFTGLKTFKRHFSHYPKGFWLPECAYTPEIGPFLRRFGVEYVILETHGVLFASPQPKYGFYAPIRTPNGLVAFARDPYCSNQVWSADEGYPGDPWYREFHWDIGFNDDNPPGLLDKVLPPGTKGPVGIKYHRVTDRKSSWKELYEPAMAAKMAWEHAGNFLFWREKEGEHYRRELGRIPIMVAPFDAELFGHWWFEGPMWLKNLFTRIARESGGRIKTVKLSQYIEIYPEVQDAEPALSSWGYEGYNGVWLDGCNDWTYKHLHETQERMIRAARELRSPTPIAERALNQAARELLLAQASDWQFIMKAGAVPSWARDKFSRHTGRCQRLLQDAFRESVDLLFLKKVENEDSLFQDLHYREFALDAEG